LARFVWAKVEEAMMGQKGTEPELEDGGVSSQAKAWLRGETREFRAFRDGLEWPSHWPRWPRIPAILLAGTLGAGVAVSLLAVARRADTRVLRANDGDEQGSLPPI
jgi:hypothetical protein